MNNSNSFLPATNVRKQIWNFSPMPAYDQTAVLNLCPVWKLSALCMKQCTAIIKPKTLVMNLQSFQIILFCFRKLIFYQIYVIISRSWFLLHFSDGMNIVTYVHIDCGITFHLTATIDVGQINWKRKKILNSVKIPGSSQIKITHFF